QELGDVPIIASNDLRTSGVIRTHHVSVLFRIELAGESRGVHQVTEHNSELSPFGFGGERGDCCGLALRRKDVRRGRQRHWRGGGRCAWTSPGPDEHSAVFIHRQLFRVDEVIFEVFQGLVIKLQPALEYPIGDTLLLLQQRKHLGQDRLVVHYRPSTCASAASVCGRQNLMSIDCHISMAVDTSVRACHGWPVAAERVPRRRWQWAWRGRMPSSSARARACW